MTMEILFMGLQQQGASLALAISQVGLDATHVGFDRQQDAARAAQEAGGIDRLVLNPFQAAKAADVLVLSPGGFETLDFLREAAPDLKPDVIILDGTPSKAASVRWAAEASPEGVAYVGLVPVLPVEALRQLGSDYRQARADLYRDQPMGMAIPANLPERAFHFAVNLVEAIGCRPFFIDAAEVDALTSMAADLPTLFGSALLALAAQSPSWPSLERIAGRPFAAASHPLGDQPAAELSAHLLANRSSLLPHLGELIERLSELRQWLQQQDESALTEFLEAAAAARRGWLAKRTRANWAQAETPSPQVPSGSYWDNLFGLGRRGRRRD